ncbi:MAG: class I SAM-dependent methyltransferase [Anaerolineales bacterium]
MPRRGARALAGLYWRLHCLSTDWGDRARIRREALAGIPPAWLRYSVAGSTDIDRYLRVGQTCSQDLMSALRGVGCHLENAGDVLDFGCGCGRTLRFLEKYSPPTRFFGSDVHLAAIAWCRRNLSFARFTRNQALPPLPYPDARFDLVYAISVLTHLSEAFQMQWLDELCRVTRPGGLLLLTVHGATALATLPPNLAEELDVARTGFAFLNNDAWKAVFPEWYQSSFQTREHVMGTFGRGLEHLGYIEAGMGAKQDVVLLRRPSV